MLDDHLVTTLPDPNKPKPLLRDDRREGTTLDFAFSEVQRTACPVNRLFSQ